MQNFGTKSDDTAGPSGQLSAAEFNNLATENENVVLRSGQALNGASETQLAQSVFLHAVKSESFQDSGAANAYVATPVSGINGVMLPADYANMNGAALAFTAAFTNTTASTLNIGQTTGTLLGGKAIRTQTDTAIPANAIIAGQRTTLVYNSAFDSGNGAWVLIPWAISVKRQTFIASGTYTPSPGMLFCDVEIVGGGGGGGGALGGAGSAAGGGGGAGGYARKLFKASDIGASKAIVIGTAGTGAAVGNNPGGTGGNTTFGGALLVGNGGVGGSGSASIAGATVSAQGGAGGTATGGDENTQGIFGSPGFIFAAGVGGLSGQGGSSRFGAGAYPAGPATSGNAGSGRGTGGGGGAANTVSAVGGPGTGGYVTVTEYCSL